MPFNFDIDKYLNRIIPRSRLDVLPYPLARFLGYRRYPDEDVKTADVTVWTWALLLSFAGVAVVELVFMHIGGILEDRGVPMIVGSMGATAVLIYNAIDSPLSQPRNVILGHALSATVGVGLTKLFELSPRSTEIRWIAGALSVGVASAIMGITKTIHPPAGATALLAATQADVRGLGWWYIPVMLLSSVIMLAVALLGNNLTRRYPKYWWTPLKIESREDADLEKTVGKASEMSPGLQSWASSVHEKEHLFIDPEKMEMPDWLKGELGEVQMGVLEEIQSLLYQARHRELVKVTSRNSHV